MATIIRLFEVAPFPNRIEVCGEAISLATIKTTIDRGTELVSLSLILPSIAYPLPVLSIQKCPKALHLVKNLFPIKISPGLPLAGKVKKFEKNWEKLTKNSTVLNIVHGYQILFIEHPYQTSLPVGGKIAPEEKELVQKQSPRSVL